MNAEERRERIIEILENANAPVTATAIASKFGVSRQVIVGDIAILRASGLAVNSLVKGYILEKKSRVSKVFKVLHTDEQVEEELGLIIDLGGYVEDVFVFHRVYGKLVASMNIRTHEDIQRFLDEIATGKSSLLKNVTSGYHYHTVSAENERAINAIETALTEKGFIAPLRSYEPIGIGEGRY